MKRFSFPVLGLALSLCIASHAAEPTGKYKVVVEQMKNLQAKYSQWSSIFSIGTNDEGVEIYALRVSTAPQMMDKTKIGQLIVATHHGNEGHAPVFAAAFAEDLLKRYSSTELYRGNLADMEWTIIPVLNVTGYNRGQREEYGEDPNRDYPGPCTKATGKKLGSIRRMIEFLDQRPFTGSVTVHGYIGSLTYPWGVDVANTHTHDHNAFEQITRNAASLNGYRHGTSTDIVYPCDGSFEDYAYWKHGAWSLLLELRNGSDTDIRNTTAAMVSYFDQLNSSPSTKHHLDSACHFTNRIDLHME